MMMKNYPSRSKTEQIIYGVHSVTEALQAGKEIEKVILQNNVHGEWVPQDQKGAART
jgi:tRNA G18 (ribose-2'-O)-methylase SpoU